jgi:Activator of Hsp90 ATPase homolog 1-like protein
MFGSYAKDLHHATYTAIVRLHRARTEQLEIVVTDRSYTTTFTVDATPHAAFTAINDVRGWWEETIAGRTHEVGDEFTHWVPGIHYARIRVTELLPGKRVVWNVLDNWMSFIDDQSEWKGTEIRFDLAPAGGGTEVRFTHVGLVPSDECFDVCRDAWSMYINDSLLSLIATGVGKPSTNPDEVVDLRVADVRAQLAAARS